MHTSESKCIGHEPCPSCGSRDNLARYDDGHAFCFGCGHYEHPQGKQTRMQEDEDQNEDTLKVLGEVKSLAKRGITEETCDFWNYRVTDKPSQVAHFYDPQNRKLIATKTRFPDKTFVWKGDAKNAPLYGQWLWRDGGKMLVITEGEIDALSVSQLQGNKWPVVSVQNGAQGSAKSIRKALEWVMKFDKVIFMFDMDDPGQAAALECAKLLPPGKAYIASLPYKDANECLTKGEGKAVIDAIWGARQYRPDGIIDGSSITRSSVKKAVKGYSLGIMPKLDKMIGGLREQEVTLLTAGSGIGKSSLAREVAYYLHQQYGLIIGNIFLEESKEKTAQGYVAIDQSVPLGDLRKNPTIISDEQWDTSLAKVVHQRMFFYDHFGSLDSDDLIEKIRYMRVALQCNFVVLDHISIVVSGQESSSEGERKDIDRLMTKLRSLVEQTGVGVIAIVHLRQPEGKPHEEGGRVTLSQLRGSGSLKQLSDNVIALERNQQGEDNHVSTVRVLKCREFGDTGEADQLYYNRQTGRLTTEVFDVVRQGVDDESEPF